MVGCQERGRTLDCLASHEGQDAKTVAVARMTLCLGQVSGILSDRNFVLYESREKETPLGQRGAVGKARVTLSPLWFLL